MDWCSSFKEDSDDICRKKVKDALNKENGVDWSSSYKEENNDTAEILHNMRLIKKGEWTGALPSKKLAFSGDQHEEIMVKRIVKKERTVKMAEKTTQAS